MFLPRHDEFHGSARGAALPIAAIVDRKSNLLYATKLALAAHERERDVSLHLVGSHEERRSTLSLINRRYAWRGYGDQHRLPVNPYSMTFTASVDDTVAGTVTLTVDSDRGLAADKTFRAELNTFRRVPGAKLCELTKLAFDSETPSKSLLAALFHIVFILGRQRHNCTDLLIEVNPRHRRFYQTMLGFERVGEMKTNDSVGAPSQLMRLQVSRIQEHIDACRDAGSGSAARSLYPDFFSAEQQAEIARMIAERQSELLPSPLITTRSGASIAPAEATQGVGLRHLLRLLMAKATARTALT